MKTYKGLLVDLDGTVYFKGQLIDGAREFLDDLKARHIPIRYVTNTTSLPPAQIVTQVQQKYAIPIASAELLNPIQVAKTYVEQYRPGTYYVMATPVVQAEFARQRWNDQHPDYVILGDLQGCCSYEELNKVFNFLSNGSQLISTSNSTYFYSANGQKHIDTGAFTGMFERALQIKAELVGKPAPLFYQMALLSLGLPKDDVLAVGDDLETDILGAQQAGIDAVLVKTGKYCTEAVQQSPIQANEVLELLPMVRKFFEKLEKSGNERILRV